MLGDEVSGSEVVIDTVPGGLQFWRGGQEEIYIALTWLCSQPRR